MGADALREVIIGESRAIVRLRERIAAIAAQDMPVLIQGPTGSGKELVARALHQLSGRRGGFVPVNVSAIPHGLVEDTFFGHVKGAFTGATRAKTGLFRKAHRGTLFLDEVGSLPLDLQPKLLRAIETRSFTPLGSETEVSSDIRFTSATNEPLGLLVEQHRFRGDLLFRIRRASLTVPSLRERLDDIPILVRHFLANGFHNGSRLEVAPDAIALLENYAWDGNVRELLNVIELLPTVRAEGTIGRNDIYSVLDELHVRPVVLADRDLLAKRQNLLRQLERAGWDTARVAEELRVHRATVYRQMTQLDIATPLRARRKGSR